MNIGQSTINESLRHNMKILQKYFKCTNVFLIKVQTTKNKQIKFQLGIKLVLMEKKQNISKMYTQNQLDFIMKK